MSTVVKNNIAAQMALGELNKNVNKAGVLLGRVSSGLKIVGAKDDAGQFAISEKMREQIRSLLQDDQNVQNGSSMLKVAAGGVDSIIEELRNLKELAINSANDHNTSQDRLTIEKEFSQKMTNVNDIATMTNYNGKTLLDGTYFHTQQEKEVEDTGKTNGGTNSGGVDSSGAFANTVTNLFTPSSELVTSTISKTGPMSWANGKPGYKAEANVDIPLDFSRAKINGNSPNLPDDMDKQGFSILCTVSSCTAFFGVMFDAEMDVGTAEKRGVNNANVYAVGIKGVDTPQKLVEALFQGIAGAVNQEGRDELNFYAGHEITLKKNGDNYTITQDFSFFVYEGYGADYAKPNDGEDDEEPKKKTVTIDEFNPLKIHHGPKANQAINIFINDMHTKSLGTKDLLDKTKNVTNEGYFINQEDEDRYWALSYDKNKQTEWVETLKLAQNKTLDDIDVKTKQNANIAVRVLDGAIDYALDESTRLGAYLQRLEYTDSNIVIMNENVQSAESTIRDADMAKEMAEYTKYNVLTQSAQAMLAQANQNSSGVLSLLQ